MALSICLQGLMVFLIIFSSVLQNLTIHCREIRSLESLREYIVKKYPKSKHLTDDQVRNIQKLLQAIRLQKFSHIQPQKFFSTTVSSKVDPSLRIEDLKIDVLGKSLETHTKLKTDTERTTPPFTPLLHPSPLSQPGNYDENATLYKDQARESKIMKLQQTSFEMDSNGKTRVEFWREFNNSIQRTDYFGGLPLWIGVCLGSAVTTITLFLILGVRMVIVRRRGRKNTLKEISFDNITEKQPVLLKLSQMHGAQPGSHYVVSVMDDKKMSMNLVSSDSEEELFDMSDIKPYHSPIKPCNTPIKSKGSFHGANKTSTPIKLKPPSL